MGGMGYDSLAIGEWHGTVWAGFACLFRVGNDHLPFWTLHASFPARAVFGPSRQEG